MPKNNKQLLFILLASLLISCSDGFESLNPISNPSNNNLEERKIYEDILFEDKIVEEQLYEIYIAEKIYVENVIHQTLLEESIIREILVLETFFIPSEDPYKYYDGAAGKSLFGENLNLNDLILKGAVGAGAILTIAVVSMLSYSNPISVAIITVAKNVLPYVIKGATVGTLIGAGTGVAVGTTDALDASGRTTALLMLGLATASLILAILVPPIGTGTFAVLGKVFLISTASIGLVTTGVDAYKTFTRTSAFDFELQNLNWDKMGYTIAEKAVQGATNGFVSGVVAGALVGISKSFVKVNGKTVLIDNSTFDPDFIDGNGISNRQRMANGLAPIGNDGYPVNLHHLDQTNNGSIVEMTQSLHRTNYFKIHTNTGDYPSLIDRPAFTIWRNGYWKWRFANLMS